MLHKVCLLFCCSFSVAFNNSDSNNIPVIIPEYRVEIYTNSRLNDTLNYRISNNEHFRFVFFDEKGKCYCERYIKNKLYQKGFYENSLDTLRRYVSSRDGSGQHSPIKVQQYFQPLKNGVWITYKGSKKIKETYSMGVLQEE
jgi:hypothetical protein